MSRALVPFHPGATLPVPYEKDGAVILLPPEVAEFRRGTDRAAARFPGEAETPLLLRPVPDRAAHARACRAYRAAQQAAEMFRAMNRGDIV